MGKLGMTILLPDHPDREPIAAVGKPSRALYTLISRVLPAYYIENGTGGVLN
jgi:hypothetical protein